MDNKEFKKLIMDLLSQVSKDTDCNCNSCSSMSEHKFTSKSKPAHEHTKHQNKKYTQKHCKEHYSKEHYSKEHHKNTSEVCSFCNQEFDILVKNDYTNINICPVCILAMLELALESVDNITYSNLYLELNEILNKTLKNRLV